MALPKRVAILSLHKSPMEQPRSGDARGMNVYIRSMASALAATGFEVYKFTRTADANRPAVERPDQRVRVHNIVAGPRRDVAKEELPELLHSMVAETDRIRLRQPSRHYEMGRAAAVQAESSDWRRTAAMTLESYRTASQQHSARSELLAL